jgi:tungstate transport system substrate-binding protein
MTPRRMVLHAVAAACLTPAARAQRAARPEPALRVGADPFVRALAEALRRGFAAYGGLAVQLDVAPSATLLDSLERGELDAAITAAPERELQLVQQGLAHDRRTIASAELVLAGPTDAGLPRGRDAAAALRAIAAAAAPMVGRGDGSALHLAEQALWRAAGVAPAAPWHRPAGADPLGQARLERAFVLVDRAGWRSGPAKDKFGVVVDSDARLQLPVQVLRSFRSAHSASRLFAAWAAGPGGQRVVAARPGLRAAGR